MASTAPPDIANSGWSRNMLRTTAHPRPINVSSECVKARTDSQPKGTLRRWGSRSDPIVRYQGGTVVGWRTCPQRCG